MKELKLQFILLSVQQGVQLHYYWFGTVPKVMINSEIETPGEKKSQRSVKILWEKQTNKQAKTKKQLAETTIEHNFL